MKVSTENTCSLKSTRFGNSDFPVSRSKKLIIFYCEIPINWDWGFFWICAKEFEFLDLEDFGGVIFTVETVIICDVDNLRCGTSTRSPCCIVCCSREIVSHLNPSRLTCNVEPLRGGPVAVCDAAVRLSRIANLLVKLAMWNLYAEPLLQCVLQPRNCLALQTFSSNL